MSFFEMLFSWTGLCTILLVFVGVLLMFIVLLQRGRGGGLAGAFGGLGGQSAFGTKAGDVFTKITVVLATIWVILAGVTGFAMRYDASKGFTEALKKPEISRDPTGKTAKTTKEKNKQKTPKENNANNSSGKVKKSEKKKSPSKAVKKPGKTKKPATSSTKVKAKKIPKTNKNSKSKSKVKEKSSPPKKKVD